MAEMVEQKKLRAGHDGVATAADRAFPRLSLDRVPAVRGLLLRAGTGLRLIGP